MKEILKSIAGGIMIGIGATAYLSADNEILGAFLFAIGLLTVCEYNLGLYTGRVGYITKNSPSYCLDVMYSLIGNFFGTLVSGTLIGFALPKVSEKAYELCIVKMSNSMISSLILSFFCGILMYIAVSVYNNHRRTARYFGIFTAVPVFIIAGFEHSVANMFYFFCGRLYGIFPIIFVAVCVIGNAIGALSVSAFDEEPVR